MVNANNNIGRSKSQRVQIKNNFRFILRHDNENKIKHGTECLLSTGNNW